MRQHPKSRSQTRSIYGRGITVAVLLAAFSATAAIAQEAAPAAWLDVAVARAAPGKGPEFTDLLKQYLAARKAAGMPVGQAYQVTAGHPNEFHVVIPVASIAANETAAPPMSPAEGVLWQSRITSTVDDVRFFYAGTAPDLSVATSADAEPSMMLLRTIRVVSGKEAEYEAWVKDQYLPAFQKTKNLGLVTSRGVFGDSPQNYYHAYPLSGWEDIDGPDPLFQVLSQQEYEQMFDALDGVVESHEMVVLRVRTDLMPE